MPDWADSQAYLSIHKEELNEQRFDSPVYGEIPKISPQQLNDPAVIFAAEDAILNYGISAAIVGRRDALFALETAASTYDPNYPGLPLLEVMKSGRMIDERVQEYTGAQIHKVCTQDDLTPNELFVACVRFTQTTRSSNFKAPLTLLLINWAKRKWSYVLEQQTFYLTNPAYNVPLIETALKGIGNDLGALGKMLVVI